MTITGFVPGYVLKSGIGKNIAGLKGLDEGWHYPTFLLYYIRNPGPLCLFDEIVIDEAAAKCTIDYLRERNRQPHSYESSFAKISRPNKAEIECLEALIGSSLFKKRSIIDLITDTDFEKIRAGYGRDTGIGIAGPTSPNREFQKALGYMTNKYGENYARPNPTCFEAMNLNVTRILSEKIGASPLDDVYRVPLYELKAIEAIDISAKDVEKAYDLINLSRSVLYLPSSPIRDVDEFLSLQGDPRMKAFREKVQALSKTNASQQQISRELFEAEMDLMKIEPEYLTLVVGFLGLVQGLTAIMQGSFLTGTIGLASGIIAYGKEWNKAFKSQRYDWLELVKGLSEL